MAEKHSLTDRTLVVSGGSRGIVGLAIASGAARTAQRRPAGQNRRAAPEVAGTVYTAAAEIEAAGGKAIAVVGDVRSEEDVARAVDAAVTEFGGVDICINNSQRESPPTPPRRCRPRSSI